MFVNVVLMLSILLTLRGPPRPLVLVVEPGWVAVVVALAVALPALMAMRVGRSALRALDAHPNDPREGQRVLQQGLATLNAMIGTFHASVLLLTDWRPMCEGLPVVGEWVVVPGLVALAPFLATVGLVWVGVHPADRAVRRIALELHLLRGKPIRPVWGLWRYLAYQYRHQVLVLLAPMLLILAATDLALMHQRELQRLFRFEYAPDVLVGAAALLVALIAPELLRHIWHTQRLPAGPLRDRLEALCGLLRFRCREILVWRSGGMIVNAAVMGVVPPLRYVLITDAMLEQMDDAKIEAVFGHEAGHVKHRHIETYLLFALISGCLLTIFQIRTRELASNDTPLYLWLVGGLALLLVLKWGVFFGWMSRRFERQADTFGIRTLSMSGLPCNAECPLHAQGQGPGGASPDDPLCRTGAAIFGDALHEVAVLNGVPADAPSWRHSSIASRAVFLQRMAASPDAYRRFQRSARTVQVAVVASALALSAWAAAEMRLWDVAAAWLGR